MKHTLIKQMINNWKLLIIIILSIYSILSTIKVHNLLEICHSNHDWDDREIDARMMCGDTIWDDLLLLYGELSTSSQLAYNLILADQSNEDNACGETYAIIHEIYVQSGRRPGPIISRLVLDCIEKQANLGSWIGYTNLSNYYSEGLFTTPDTIKSALYKSKQDSLLKMERLRRNSIE